MRGVSRAISPTDRMDNLIVACPAPVRVGRSYSTCGGDGVRNEYYKKYKKNNNRTLGAEFDQAQAL